MMKIDLNSDLGESFGMYTIGNDSDVLNYVSSANIACGMHAGDPSSCTRRCAWLWNGAWQSARIRALWI